MELDDSVEVFRPVAEVLESLGVPYQIGGSVASSVHGTPRGTNDVDVEVHLREEHVREFVARLEKRFIVTPSMVSEAIRRRTGFNLIPFDAIAKIDIFIPKDRPFDREAATRRVYNVRMEDGTTFPYPVDSPEDSILRKLEWYRKGGEVSDAKWLDVLGMMKAQVFDLDFDYLEHWAKELRVADLLERALDESGLKETEQE